MECRSRHGSWADKLQGASFYCTGVGSDHSLCLHACELLARAVAAGLCAETLKVAANRYVEFEDLSVEAAISIEEEAAELKLSHVELVVSATSAGLTEPRFKKLVEEARSKCPTESLLPFESRISVVVKAPVPTEQF